MDLGLSMVALVDRFCGCRGFSDHLRVLSHASLLAKNCASIAPRNNLKVGLSRKGLFVLHQAVDVP